MNFFIRVSIYWIIQVFVHHMKAALKKNWQLCNHEKTATYKNIDYSLPLFRLGRKTSTIQSFGLNLWVVRMDWSQSQSEHGGLWNRLHLPCRGNGILDCKQINFIVEKWMSWNNFFYCTWCNQSYFIYQCKYDNFKRNCSINKILMFSSWFKFKIKRLEHIKH